MLPELTALLEQVPDGSDRVAFRKLVIGDNLFARPSLRSREKIWKALIARYLLDPATLPFKVFVRHYRDESSPSQRALLAYLLFSINDTLFFDLNRYWLPEQLQYPSLQVTSADLEKFFEGHLERSHPEVRTWSESTRTNILRHYLTALRDFGFAEGKRRKSIIRPVVGPSAALFVCDYELSRGVKPRRVLESDLLTILGLNLEGVVGLLFELNASGTSRPVPCAKASRSRKTRRPPSACS